MLVASVLSLFALAATASNVVDLTPENFDEYIDGSKFALVEFFAPWCGHCKNLAPVYEELADAFAHAKDKVVIAKVDADAHRDLGTKFDVKGFPTLKWFPKGKTEPEAYEGGRDLNDFAQYITQRTGTISPINAVNSVRRRSVQD
jgi:protein disulfide-isomerase A6